jgi:hypothetical protein
MLFLKLKSPIKPSLKLNVDWIVSWLKQRCREKYKHKLWQIKKKNCTKRALKLLKLALPFKLWNEKLMSKLKKLQDCAAWHR